VRTAGQAALRLAAHLRRERTDRPVWVFGAVSGREYCDNSQALFEHVRAERPDVRAVWQIDGDSPDVERLPTGAEWVDRTSFAAHRITQAAEVIVFSHGTRDIAGLYANRRAVVVRLGHGLTAFGITRGATPFSVRRMTRRVSLAPVASEFERAHKRQWGFAADQLPITGLARWDGLRARRAATEVRDTVLFAPTWRAWLTADDFEASDYWGHVRSVLGDEAIRAKLRQAGLRLAVFGHPAIRSMLADRVHDLPVDVIDHGADLQGALARSALFLTDWSSIAFDALALRVPTLFFHFDLDRYSRERGSYVDLRQRLFGPTAHDLEGVRTQLAAFADAGLAFPAFADDVERWSATAFAFEDQQNCARVRAAIEDLITSRGAGRP
jgi:hypothetical protein